MRLELEPLHEQIYQIENSQNRSISNQGRSNKDEYELSNDELRRRLDDIGLSETTIRKATILLRE